MSQVLAPTFALGTNSDYVVSSNVTDAPIDSACTATINTKALSATNASFAAGQLILIHQTRGTGAGQWELNRVGSYSVGTITTQLNMTYSYASGAQVIVVKEYTSINIQSTFTLTGKAWNGTVGGIVTAACSGKATIAGTISVNGVAGGVRTSDGTLAGGAGIGFRGGTASVQTLNVTSTGEGTTGASVVNQKTANGNGGGGGLSVASEANAGAGGGNGAVGIDGQEYTQGGKAGGTAGNAALTNMVFGGGGGGGGRPTAAYAGAGAGGAGIVFIMAKQIVVTGAITANGGASGALTGSSPSAAGGGAGAGGSIFLRGQVVTLGSGLVTALGGIVDQTSPPSIPSWGGAGGVGRINVEAGTISGTTTPTYNEIKGGLPWLGKVGAQG